MAEPILIGTCWMLLTIQKLLTRDQNQRQSDKIHGNEIRIRVMPGGKTFTSKVVRFVHNPEPDPTPLFDLIVFAVSPALASRTTAGS
jgi:hypothetical protein